MLDSAAKKRNSQISIWDVCLNGYQVRREEGALTSSEGQPSFSTVFLSKKDISPILLL